MGLGLANGGTKALVLDFEARLRESILCRNSHCACVCVLMVGGNRRQILC